MNAIDMLKEDHRIVDALFSRIEDTPPSEHPAIFKRIKGELDAHAHVEETIFYPAAKRKGKKDLKDLVLEAVEEHGQMKKFLGEISRGRSVDKREAKLKVLIEDTRHHVKEEEDEMFPLCEEQLGEEELEKLGARMERAKLKFQKEEGITPEDRDEYKGVAAKAMDKLKELGKSITGEGSGKEPATSRSAGSGSRSAGKARGRSASK